MAAGGFLLDPLIRATCMYILYIYIYIYVIAGKRLHVSDHFMWIINQLGLLERIHLGRYTG